ncbi:MAG: hypothetical protein ACPGVT_10915 [Maricaulaceae bacterium]
MKLSSLGRLALSVAILGSITTPTIAQDAQSREVIRTFEPAPYWVEVDQLRVRDNPVAGDVVGMVKLGDKIQAYDKFENWVLISKPDEKEKWLNVDFLTEDHVNWARYDNNATRRHRGFNRSNIAADVSLDRIRVPEEKSARIYAASVKETNNGNRVVVTRQNFRAGPHFEKRLIACDDEVATRMQLLGEGYNYMMMERDMRGQSVDLDTHTPRSDLRQGEFSPTVMAVAKYACEADA